MDNEQYKTKLPKFCSKCGRLLNIGKKNPNAMDNQTGEIESWRYILKCSIKFLGWGFHHDEYLIIETPHHKVLNEPHRTILVRR